MLIYLGELLVRISAVALSLGILVYASYSSENTRYIKLAASVLLLSVVLSFVPTLLSEGVPKLSEIIEEIKAPQQTPDGGAFSETAQGALEEGIRALVSQKYGISLSDITVRVLGLDVENMRAEKIEITLFGSGAVADWRAIRDYVNSEGLGECEVKLNFA